MGKIDDMRRLREQQFADERPTRTTKASAKADVAGVVEGKCSGCGKTKPVSNGLVSNHQKGFGKACTGSRKKPV